MWTDRDPATREAVDRLLREIEDAGTLPGSLWHRVVDTLAYLDDVAGEDAPMVSVGFLRDVIRRGPEVFPVRARQEALLDDAPTPTVECPAGHAIAADAGRDYGTVYLHGRCPEHFYDVVRFPERLDGDAPAV